MWSPLQVNHSQNFLLQPRVSMCTHTHPYRFVFLLLCFTVWWDWLNLEKKKKTKTKPQTLIPQSPQFLEACQGEHILKWEFTTHFGDLTNQPGFSSGLSRWRSSLSGKVPGFLQVCEPFIRVIIPIPLSETQPGADLSAGTLSSRVQNSSKCCTTCSLCGFW